MSNVLVQETNLVDSYDTWLNTPFDLPDLVEEKTWVPLSFEPIQPTAEELPTHNYNFEFIFFTGLTSLIDSKPQKRVDFAVRVDDQELFNGLVRVLEDERYEGYDRSRRSRILMECLISMTEANFSPKKLVGQAYLIECPIFQSLREEFGLRYLCCIRSAMSSQFETFARFSYLVPLFEKDLVFLPKSGIDPYFKAVTSVPYAPLRNSMGESEHSGDV